MSAQPEFLETPLQQAKKRLPLLAPQSQPDLQLPSNLPSLPSSDPQELGQIIDAKKAILRSVENRIVTAQQSFNKQFDQLQQKLIDTSTELQRKQNELREYNRAAIKIRQADEAREKDLRTREKKLEAERRAHYTEQINLAAEKKRFYQTKELQ